MYLEKNFWMASSWAFAWKRKSPSVKWELGAIFFHDFYFFGLDQKSGLCSISNILDYFIGYSWLWPLDRLVWIKGKSPSSLPHRQLASDCFLLVKLASPKNRPIRNRSGSCPTHPKRIQFFSLASVKLILKGSPFLKSARTFKIAFSLSSILPKLGKQHLQPCSFCQKLVSDII